MRINIEAFLTGFDVMFGDDFEKTGFDASFKFQSNLLQASQILKFMRVCPQRRRHPEKCKLIGIRGEL